jgi:molybdate transport system substrate-binding protein
MPEREGVMKNPTRLLLAAALLAIPVAQAADIKVLCSQPMRGPLAGIAEAFQRDTGHRVELVFGVSDEMLKRLAAGEPADAVVLTRRFFETAVKAGHVVGGSGIEVGRLGIGVVVRAGAAVPDISTPEALKRALLDADTVVFNQRASGIHFAGVLERLGIAGAVKARSRRPEVDADVFEQIQKGKGRDVGVVLMASVPADGGKTVKLVGPLPAKLQSYEPYFAGLTTNARTPVAAKAFAAFLTSAKTKATLAQRGVDQAK